MQRLAEADLGVWGFGRALPQEFITECLAKGSGASKVSGFKCRLEVRGRLRVFGPWGAFGPFRFLLSGYAMPRGPK